MPELPRQSNRPPVCSVCHGELLSGVPGSGEPKWWCPEHPHAEPMQVKSYSGRMAQIDRNLRKADRLLAIAMVILAIAALVIAAAIVIIVVRHA
jgi:hypothetical protein